MDFFLFPFYHHEFRIPLSEILQEGVISHFQRFHVSLSLDAYAFSVIPKKHIQFFNQRNSSRLQLVMRTSDDVSKEDKYHTGV